MQQEPNTINAQQIQDVITASNMLDCQATLTQQINDAAFPEIRLDPNTLYCSKTGQPIGMRDANSIFSAIAILGKTDFLANAFLAHGLHYAPAWVKSDEVILDRLLEQDPIGFCSYALGVLTAKYMGKPARPDRETDARQHYALARCYAILAGSNWLNRYDPLKQAKPISELNFKLMELLTYAPTTAPQMKAKLKNLKDNQVFLMAIRNLEQVHKRPDYFASLAICDQLGSKIDDCVETAMKQVRNHDEQMALDDFEGRPATPADMARGPSNIRLMRGSKRAIKARQRANQLFQQFDRIADVLGGFGNVFSEEELAERKRKMAMREAKLDWRANLATKAIPTTLEELENFDLSDWASFKPEEESDFEVEVKTISRKEAAILVTAKSWQDQIKVVVTIPVPVAEPKPQVINPIAALIAARKGGSK